MIKFNYNGLMIFSIILICELLSASPIFFFSGFQAELGNDGFNHLMVRRAHPTWRAMPALDYLMAATGRPMCSDY
jgi:hypothetical protein